MSAKLITKASGKNDSVILKIEKDFSIVNVESIKLELEEIIKQHSAFHLEMKHMETFDLSAIQVLYALKKKFGNGFTFSLTVKDEIKTILRHSGFEKYISK